MRCEWKYLTGCEKVMVMPHGVLWTTWTNEYDEGAVAVSETAVFIPNPPGMKPVLVPRDLNEHERKRQSHGATEVGPYFDLGWEAVSS
jgi:hypothetical protein